MADSITFGQQVTDDAMMNSQQQMMAAEVPPSMKILENFPTLSASIGTAAFRGSNTILYGGYAPGAGGINSRGFFRQAIANNNPLNPRNWMRYRSDTHLAGGFVGGKYSPFQAADAMNYLADSISGAKRAQPKGAPRATKASRFLQSDKVAQRLGIAGAPARTAWSGGFYSRLSAAGRIGAMSDARFARVAAKGNLSSFIGKATGVAGPINPMDRGAAQRALLTSGTGRMSSYAGGFMSAFTEGGLTAGMPRAPGMAGPVRMTGVPGMNRFATKGHAAATRAAGALGINMASDAGTLTMSRIAKATRDTAKGAAWAGKAGKLATFGKGAGLMAGRAALMASSAVNPLMWAWMAYDLTKMGVTAAGYGLRTAAEGYRSFQGGLNRRIGQGEGFVDTAAASTARARGVMAIQSSRLNARSVIGNEAGAMASHFG